MTRKHKNKNKKETEEEEDETAVKLCDSATFAKGRASETYVAISHRGRQEKATCYAAVEKNGRWKVKKVQMGLSTGPCSGGIIGKSMWLYDIWSDTVNLAARLRAKAPPGCIMCCTTTCQRLEGLFDFGEPLQLQLKGKGFQSLYPLLSEHVFN
eukprot:m51a1_g11254 putative adenylyl cyclase (154) ;mRNA; r:49748-55873